MSGTVNSTVRGLVLRETDYRDSDRIITLLCAERGRISAACRRARSGSSRLKAGTQLLVCSDFTLYESRGRYTVDSAEPVEQFLGLRESIEALSLASYFAELLECVSLEETPSGGVLSDALNALYALSRGLRPRAQIKAALELRLCALSGWMPDLGGCAACGKELSEGWLSVAGGELFCADCRPPGVEAAWLNAGALSAARYLLAAPSKRMLAFSLERESLELLAAACERYILAQLERGFDTLNFYKTVEAAAP